MRLKHNNERKNAKQKQENREIINEYMSFLKTLAYF